MSELKRVIPVLHVGLIAKDDYAGKRHLHVKYGYWGCRPLFYFSHGVELGRFFNDHGAFPANPAEDCEEQDEGQGEEE